MGFEEMNFTEKLTQPKGLAAGLAEGNVLCFTGRIGDSLLAVGGPSEDGTTNRKTISHG